MSHGSVVYDPTGSLGANIPLDRDLNGRLATTVLGWTGDRVPPPADIEQAALHLSGYARLLVRELRSALARAQALAEPTSDIQRAEITLAEANRRLKAPAIRHGDTLKQAQSRALLVQALQDALDRTTAALPAPEPVPGS
ncbi:restriction endonuclease [Streptomyces sp. NPDC050600]|uniref:restriction endonuclease n=1 Tax=Streptomyces sp. NPDC050600 TaxID=3157213 RepID=UPI00343FEC8F